MDAFTAMGFIFVCLILLWVVAVLRDNLKPIKRPIEAFDLVVVALYAALAIGFFTLSAY
jgi:hypothetical protein